MNALVSFKFSVLLLGIASIGLMSCGGDKATAPNTKQATVAVTLSQPTATQQTGISASGQIEAGQTAAISTRVMGYITKLSVKVGDYVQKGQVIATINNQDMGAKKAQTDAAIAEAEAHVKNAQKDFDRFTALYNQQSATAKELDNVTLQYNAAKARLAAAKEMRNEVSAMMNYTVLTAPFSGVVVQKNAEAGTMASPGMPIVVIEQGGSFQVSAAIPENAISTVKIGDVAQVLIKSTGKTFSGKIIQLNPSSQFTGGQYIVKIAVPDNDKKGLYSGMYVNVSIEGKTVAAKPATDVVLIPLSSVVYKDQLAGVYTVSTKNTALLRWLRLGKTYGTSIEVLSGLSATEQFILSAEGRLFNGAAVTVKQ